jgi:hypothetical protein
VKTDDLIRLLAADQAATRPSPLQVVTGALVVGGVAALGLFVWRMNIRPDLFIELGNDPRVALKFLVTLALAMSAAALLTRMISPGAAPGIWLPAMFIGPALLGLGAVYELSIVEPSAWSARMIGRNSMFCLQNVPLLAAPVLVALLVALRRGAPTRPAFAGALAGLVAGGIGGAIYAMHCPDDSPLFVAAWYGLAIALVTLVGALAGWRLLRW